MADPIHQFVITPLIPLEIGGVDVSFTNSALWMSLAVVASFVLFVSGSTRKALVPDRIQSIAEMGYEFIANLVKENIGTKGMQYFPLIFCLFFFILMGNVLGLLPASFTFTSHIIVTFMLALLVFLGVTILGFVNHGTHFFSLFMPAGTPWPLLLLIVPLELISFAVRPITLSVRLFANMMAGHLMLKVFASFSVMLVGLGTGGILLGLVPVAFNAALLALELLVAVLQAYIFAILSCIYLKDTVDLHH